MSRIIRARNVNTAFMDGWHWLLAAGAQEHSRNGPALVAPGMVITEYERPRERVLFNPVRDANPVFHLMECIWMLAGDNSIGWLSQFNANIAKYAEVDGNIHGAYGYRWRTAHSFDQLFEIVDMLKEDPTTRHAVLQMWDCEVDLTREKLADRPCNTHAYFDLRNRALNMTVCCRSNDMLWGAYGANAVHFSFLQEVLAHALNVPVGIYRQMSNNFHVYTDNEQVKHFLDNPPSYDHDYYAEGTATALPLLQPEESWKNLLFDCEDMAKGEPPKNIDFMKRVAHPLMVAYLARRRGESWDIDDVPDCDWKLAFSAWVDRRNVK